MSTEIALTNDEQALIKAVDQCHEIASMANNTIKSLQLGKAIQALKAELMKPHNAEMIMGFQNTAMGFLTDSKTGYQKNVVIMAAMEAFAAGAYLHNNEFNIIAGRCYFAQNFFVRKVREYCTLHRIKRHFEYECKYVKEKGKQHEFLVKVTITWKFPDSKERETTVEKYNLVGMTQDQVIGKAKKRAHQWLYNELTDNNFALAPDTEYDFEHNPNENVEKPSFDPNPDPVKYLIEKHGAPTVSGYLKEIEFMKVNENLEDLQSDSNRIELIKNSLSDFDKKIDQYSKI